MSNDKPEDLLRDCLSDYSHPNFTDRRGMADRIRAALAAHAAEAAQPLPQMTDAEHAEILAKYGTPQAAEPVAYGLFTKSGLIRMWSKKWFGECYGESCQPVPLYTHPQPPAQDAKDAAIPLKGWIFDRVDMGRGDERYICTPDGANATTVRNESTSDHRERMLWLIADAMAKESGR